MAETSRLSDVPSWGFDPFNPGPGFSLEPGVLGEEELWYRSQFDMNGFDLPQWQPAAADDCAGYDLDFSAAGKAPSNASSHHLSSAFSGTADAPPPPPNRSDKVLSRQHRFAGFHLIPNSLATDTSSSNPNNAPYTLDELFQCASQLATERALYMNVPVDPPSVQGSPSYHPSLYNSSSPIADPSISSPSETSHRSLSSASDADWDHEQDLFEFAQVYRLPATESNEDAVIDGYLSPIHQSLHPVAAAAIEPPSKDDAALLVSHQGHSSPSSPLHQQQQQNQIKNNNKNNNNINNNNNTDYDDDHLTPLQMPDGSTRFTSNWLPVDPKGGFTIHTPAAATTTVMPGFFDLDQMAYEAPREEYNYHNAFISLDTEFSYDAV